MPHARDDRRYSTATEEALAALQQQLLLQEQVLHEREVRLRDTCKRPWSGSKHSSHSSSRRSRRLVQGSELLKATMNIRASNTETATTSVPSGLHRSVCNPPEPSMSPYRLPPSQPNRVITREKIQSLASDRSACQRAAFMRRKSQGEPPSTASSRSSHASNTVESSTVVMPFDKNGALSEPHVADVLKERGSFAERHAFDYHPSPIANRMKFIAGRPAAVVAESSSGGYYGSPPTLATVPPQPLSEASSPLWQRPPKRERLVRLAIPRNSIPKSSVSVPRRQPLAITTGVSLMSPTASSSLQRCSYLPLHDERPTSRFHCSERAVVTSVHQLTPEELQAALLVRGVELPPPPQSIRVYLALANAIQLVAVPNIELEAMKPLPVPPLPPAITDTVMDSSVLLSAPAAVKPDVVMPASAAAVESDSSAAFAAVTSPSSTHAVLPAASAARVTTTAASATPWRGIVAGIAPGEVSCDDDTAESYSLSTLSIQSHAALAVAREGEEENENTDGNELVQLAPSIELELTGALAELGSTLYHLGGAQQRELLLAVGRCLSMVICSADATPLTAPEEFELLTHDGSLVHFPPDAMSLVPPCPAVALRLTHAIEALLCCVIDGGRLEEEASLAWLTERLEQWPRLDSKSTTFAAAPTSAAPEPGEWPQALYAAPGPVSPAVSEWETGRVHMDTLTTLTADLAERLRRGLSEWSSPLADENAGILRALSSYRAWRRAHGTRRRIVNLIGKSTTCLLPLLVMASSALTAWILTSAGGTAEPGPHSFRAGLHKY